MVWFPHTTVKIMVELSSFVNGEGGNVGAPSIGSVVHFVLRFFFISPSLFLLGEGCKCLHRIFFFLQGRRQARFENRCIKVTVDRVMTTKQIYKLIFCKVPTRTDRDFVYSSDLLYHLLRKKQNNTSEGQISVHKFLA